MAEQNKKSQLIWVWPEQLVPRKQNNRFDYGDLTELGKSILSNGIQLPLKVRKLKEKTDDGYPKYEVVDGHRRLKAANKVAEKMEEGDFIPIMVMEDTATEADCIITALITGEQGKQRNMLEAALDIQALVAGGMKQSEIAKQIGKSAVYVGDCVFLYENATDAIIQQIKQGHITPYQAIEMLKETPAQEVEEAVSKAATKKAKRIEEESIANPDKKANVKTKLKKTEIEEEHGAPMTTKGKKSAAAESSRQQAGGATEPKQDASLAKLIQLKETMKANAGIKNERAFSTLYGLIKYLKGSVTALELLDVFFDNTEEEEAPAPKKAAKAKKEEASAKAPTKGATPLNKKKANPVEEEEEPAEDELEELPELDELEDDDFEE